MESKHTPGPWIVDYGLTIGHIKSVNPKYSPNTPTVARYDISVVCITPEEKSANARLIATSPELLEVLEDILETWDEPYFGDHDTRSDWLFDKMEKARLIVNKAKKVD